MRCSTSTSRIARTTRSAASPRGCSNDSGSASRCSATRSSSCSTNRRRRSIRSGRVEVREIVRAARDRGATVILNSHLLTEVEQVCDRVIIVNRGRIVAAGTLDEVIAGDGVRIRATGLEPAVRAGLGTFAPMQDDGEWLTFQQLAPDRVPELVAAIVAAGGRVHAVEPGRGSLEARFLELIAADGSTEP